MDGKFGNRIGNQNASKGLQWRKALQRSLAQYEDESSGITRGEALRQIADNVVRDALANNQWAIKEIADRLDGKPAQAVIAQDSSGHDIAMVSDVEIARRLLYFKELLDRRRDEAIEGELSTGPVATPNMDSQDSDARH